MSSNFGASKLCIVCTHFFASQQSRLTRLSRHIGERFDASNLGDKTVIGECAVKWQVAAEIMSNVQSFSLTATQLLL